MTDVRWVAYHATRGANGEREDRRAGAVDASSESEALRKAVAVHGAGVAVMPLDRWHREASRRLDVARQREREAGVGKPKHYGKSQGRSGK
jgi:hypothetical protein